MKIRAQQENIDRCRFCFMCRHVCTLGRVTSEEALTPRSQALGLSMILRDAMEYDGQLVENIYKCCLCGYCKDWCQGGWDFPSSVKAARQDIVAAGLAPQNVEDLKDEILQHKNAYGKTAIDPALKKAIESHRDKAETLVLYGNDVLYAAPEIGLSFMEILEKAGIDFMPLPDEDTSAYELYSLGYLEEAKTSAAALVAAIKGTGAKRLIVLSPDVEAFLANDLSMLDISLADIDIVGGVKCIHSLLEDAKIKISKQYQKKITYHDCNGLARETKAIDEPRAIIDRIPGGAFTELVWNKNEAHSTGSNLVSRLYPHIAKDILDKRVEDIREIESDVVITSCVYDKLGLAEIFGDEKEVIDIYELVAKLI